MKVGIIGGIGPEATTHYYISIIKQFQDAVGSDKVLPEMVVESINMYHMFEMLEQRQYDDVAEYLAHAACNLQKAGADFGVMCGNTPHIVFEKIQGKTDLPLLSMVQCSLDVASAMGLKRLALLGTKFTMQNDFFKRPFEMAGISIYTPSPVEQETIHQKIVGELENGIVTPDTKSTLLTIINGMIKEHGLDGVILGCTELPLILNQRDFSIEVLDIAKEHINAIVKKLSC
ncbi:uncharacterized protein GVI51_D01089 [Nakaseomyces glabratus]|uniref:Aspartate racemase n=2 Tax=Candida glabrata TaxID=5478 RepID=Q6FWC7_CANGA|nr:uncharacterized protein CAGL0D01210g [Nakaseomyces glabratus]KAH7608199.1 Asp/Glu/Hydantoin racemase [Nakaseomyces glabratus]KAH7608316.1 Asp/Glu/Hydantoin racemase [Nakaseomyces glabratus]KTB01717.1 Uncharacterized protein YgeA [Nakaseomyces glabratus]KTB03677.1 Uncharacterized protein YgeA [Nakaseomyces glabratus]KTB09356.1 Uncharacterized protein YgeA [Nakaseomyces glabratus]|eukprot:XP_445467.1 uncharacterized protein CAGL0D01210g [[Candida] glabrata]